ncbi:MAG: 4Fe-4S dicluster domain-containing protein [Acidobacteria bacterium]|nr:4Fe-4S dicluster domain-containing protein [Acidobacteriota bacterium]
MARLGMVIDLKRCVGCNACTIACKQENGTPAGVHFARVINREVGTYPNVKRTFLPVLCNHCDDAPCLKACPTGATFQRPDGIVMVDDDSCIGCRACAVSCPYLNRHFIDHGMLQKGLSDDGLTPFEQVKFAGFQEGTMTKCTFCAHRVDHGLQPACVITCPTEARIFGDLDEENGILQTLIRERNSWTLLPEAKTKPCVYYLDE